MKTARLCLIDTIGCGLEGLRVDPSCAALMEPIVEVSSALLERYRHELQN